MYNRITGKDYKLHELFIGTRGVFFCFLASFHLCLLSEASQHHLMSWMTKTTVVLLIYLSVLNVTLRESMSVIPHPSRFILTFPWYKITATESHQFCKRQTQLQQITGTEKSAIVFLFFSPQKMLQLKSTSHKSLWGMCSFLTESKSDYGFQLILCIRYLCRMKDVG